MAAGRETTLAWGDKSVFAKGGLRGICNGVSKDIFNGSFIVGYHDCEMSRMAKISDMLIWLTAKESKCGD